MKSLISSYFKKFLDWAKGFSTSGLKKVYYFTKNFSAYCIKKLSTYLKKLPSAKRYTVLALIAVLVLVLIFGLSRCSNHEVPVEESISFVVCVDDLEVHKNAKASSRVLSHLPADLEIEVLEQKNVKETTWGRIDKMKLEDGTKVKAGWIDLQCVRDPDVPVIELEAPTNEEEVVEDVPPAVTVNMGTITASKLNIRKGPEEKYEKTGAYYKGDRVEILEVQTSDGTTWGRTNQGWIGMGFVRMDGNVNEGASINLVTNGDTTVLGYGVVELGELNVRLGPGTEYGKVNTIKKATRYAYYQTSNTSGIDWVRIEDGWVSTEYFYLEGNTADNAMNGTVTSTTLNIRTGPATSFQSIGAFQEGETISILAQVAGWGYTEQGWVFMSYVEPVEPTYSTGTCTVTRGLNIRQEPNADSEIVGTLTTGNIVTILEVDGSWGRIVNGWINLKFVEFE